MGRRQWEEAKRERLEGLTAAERAEYEDGYARAALAYAIGEQARKIRESLGMSQQELAEKAGTSQSAIARLEAGGVEPKLDTLDRISRALGTNLVVRFEAKEAALQPA